MAKMWAGVTAGVTDSIADDFNSSIRFDCKMYKQDITGSMAHAAMLGAKNIILTGVGFHPAQTGVMISESGVQSYYCHRRLSENCHGTGDVFASTCVGALMNGKPLPTALRIAADYTADCIRATEDDPNGNWYGVNFERALPYLIDQLREDGQRSNMRF